MTDPMTGGCRCGAVRYTLAVDALPPTYACHCHQCQKWTGSAFSLQALVPEAAITIGGPLATFERRTEDRVSTQHVCGECHARIYNTNTRRPGLAVVRAGTLDESELLECRAHIFTATRQRWLLLPDDVPQWPEMAPSAEMIMLMMRS